MIGEIKIFLNCILFVQILFPNKKSLVCQLFKLNIFSDLYFM